MKREEEIKHRYERIDGELNERTRRLFAANEAMAIGWGGISVVSRATGLARQVISAGIKELQEGQRAGEGRIRRIGGGRKSTVSKDPRLREDLERLVEPVTRGDPESPLRWTSKSVRKLAKELHQMGHQVSHELVSELLHGLGYSLQANRKTREGGTHPDRDAQFAHLNAQAEAFLAAGEPVVSVDAKKKELVGDFKNVGREWRPQGEPEQVQVYDFPIPGLGRATPYGVYDLGRNTGWVNVGIDHNTAAFAVESIRRWWNEVGRQQYPQAKRLLISADGGGSNGSRVRLWKWEVQQLADETGLSITVCHLPPGTSKWNKIEHRLFAWISQNWRGKPLTSYAVILKLIAATTTEAGLTVQCQLDTNRYPAGRKLSDEEMATLSIQPDSFHGEWNYTILPRAISFDNVIT
ncbi:MAG TPA: ISAzo13 family transposase [Ktedonobacteraceae bacterium]|nr:ISAzo13 family transposase [Ktedonobacteraceae bacterium]